MTTAFKPLLAATCDDIRTLNYPVLASPKLDGIRCVKLDGKALSRKLKPIPNDFVRNWIEANLPDGIDGELLVRGPRERLKQGALSGDWSPVLMPFNEVSSAIMSKDGEPDFMFLAFDLLEPVIPFTEYPVGEAFVPFEDRYDRLEHWFRHQWCGHEEGRLFVVPHNLIENARAMQALVEEHTASGYEGTMVRDPNGRYKFGRSTVREGILLKIKAFVDEEATVIGVVEQMHNANEATLDNLGHTKRSSAKAGKVGTGKLGALVCRLEDGTEFEIGSGFTDSERLSLWYRATVNSALSGLGALLIGKQVKFKHQPPPGGRQPGEKPRFPVFLGWRED